MTEEQANERAAALNAEHPDRAGNRWVARSAAAGWEVVRVGLPAARPEETQAEQHSSEGPPSAEDPRSSHERNVGGPWLGGG
jgi:hypothetical protein